MIGQPNNEMAHHKKNKIKNKTFALWHAPQLIKSIKMNHNKYNKYLSSCKIYNKYYPIMKVIFEYYS
jgi:hypothetical protein